MEKFDVRGSNTNIVVSQTIEAIVKPPEVDPKQNVYGKDHCDNFHVDDEFGAQVINEVKGDKDNLIIEEKDKTIEVLYDE